MTRKFFILFAAALALAANARSAPAPVEGGAVQLGVEGPIGPATAEYVRDGLREAARRNAAAVVLTLDTPGGLQSSMRDIIRGILQSPVPVISFVSPIGARAASAGTYIVYASHLAAMAPSTHLGAATPVELGSIFSGNEGADKGKEKPVADAAATKAVNDAAAYIKSLAELRGRNVDWAEQAVRRAATLTASEALRLGVVELSARDVPELLREADGRVVRVGDRDFKLHTAGAIVTKIEPDWRANLLSTISNPTIAYLLLLVGFYGLFFEFISPGGVAPGVIGGVALMVGLYGLNFLPISFAGAGLLLLGLAFMTAEAFVPSFGALGVGGVVAFALGSLLLIHGDAPGFRLPLGVIGAATAVSAAFILVALSAIWRAQRRRVATGDPGLLGDIGEVLAWRDFEGEIRVHGERWRARAATVLAPGQCVSVVERRGLTLLVEAERPSSNGS
ncbi:nodulation protein NfeD [Rhodoblastus acidophilus]|uniref:Nodulation protein NfeD n=1 Tax=Candidatus Rhodoblastus alkanivorans TaxID=2954117 RepID=A0ABS9Z297_9HYPH|nr:nodulation protein NfeD [Candidatus Rhodoblastus alkanivorans]MCI4678161.1 nodulation protein NfeD [Candidatus Rhodoblastus alkanivorans]MCI4681211.1 nodulation protein NfeD [Candidatus Rhodoblastus alkanivorans]MDI4642254.1 nodulation protein NfeD [Rhodoblastus acidophilus]